MGINIVLLIIASLFFAVGICISKLKWYWLISGYNTMSKEEKSNVEIEALGKHMGKMFLLISILNIIGFILNHFFYISLAIFIVLTVIILLYSIYYCQRFDHNPGSSKETKIVLAVVIFIMLITTIPIIAISYSSTKVTLTDTSIKISSGVNAYISKDKIKSVSLVDEMPKILLRTGGIGMGRIQKGNYNLEGDIDAKLFLASKEGPFIEIIVDSKPSHYYINYKDKENTKTTYEDIMKKLDLDK
ncbi:DUF3784 domain-containing protein [uncultured Clostridium sp.]|uniref:DUF3784 domain-containing protein n=1 Tax=uncultured Clostridium sp. TaxID=59620 RepID=UPI003216608B